MMGDRCTSHECKAFTLADGQFVEFDFYFKTNYRPAMMTSRRSLKRLSTLFRIVFSLTVWALLYGTAQSQTYPNANELLGSVSAHLPPFLRADDLALAKPSISESGGHKRLIYKFDVAISATEPLFFKTREVGPFAIVIPTMQQDSTLRLTGLLDLTFKDGDWNTGISLDQDLEKLGRPIDRFGLLALISGDPESEAKVALLRGEVEAAALKALGLEINAKIAELRTAGEAQVLAERQRGAAELLAVIADHATKRGSLIAKQRQQIAELETGLAAERQSLTRQVAAAEDVRQLQTRLQGALQIITVNELASLAAFTKLRSERLRFLDALPKEWTGIVQCTDDSNPLNTKSTPLTIGFGRVLASGFSADFYPRNNSKSGGWDGAIVIEDKAFVFPLHLKFSAPGLNGSRGNRLLPDNFSLELSADGMMHGTEPMMVKWSKSSIALPTTCIFDLSG